MKITNDLNFPLPLVKAVEGDGYSKGDAEFSTTELINPPRIAVLRRQWNGHLVEDVADRIFALIGKSIHTILEHSAEAKRYLVEKRFFHEHNGHRIGGQIDLFDRKTGALQDWKITSYHSTNDARLAHPWDTIRTVPEGKGWIEQGNVNRYLMYRNGLNVKSIQIVAIYRDWSKMQVIRGKGQYPPRQVEVLRVPLWTYTETEDYLTDRIKAHLAAREELPMCSDEERWVSRTGWAVTKFGNKKAYRVLDTELEAQELAAQMSNGKAKYLVEERKPEYKRCLYYCDVAGYCSFGRELMAKKQEEAA